MSSKSRNHITPSLHSSPKITQSIPKSGSFIDTLKDGFAIGIGSNLAERAISSIIPRTVVHQHTSDPDCNEINRIYKEHPSSTLEEAFNKCKK